MTRCDRRRSRTTLDVTGNRSIGRWAQPRLVRLEDRTVPSSTLYVDFGDNFPTGGFDLTDLQLRTSLASGGLSGPNLSFSDATLYRFRPASERVTFDYNGSGGVNAQDWIDLRANVFSLIQRYYEPFDVNVVLAPALDNTNSTTYFDGIRAALNAGPNVTGERDSWAFSIYGTVASTGNPISSGGLYGVASALDIGGNNANDDSCVSFADAVLAANPNANADNALAYTTSHEPAHCFGLAHTSNSSQLSNSDVIVGSAGTTNRTNYDFFTRYPLTLSGSSSVVTNHDRYASTSVLGLRSGAPVYVTGTGEHDIVTITRLNATQATVTVQAFSNATYTTPIAVPGGGGATTYSYTLNNYDANGILVDLGFDNDRLVVDASLGVPITVRGMAGTDQLIVNGGGAATATYAPNATAPVGLDGNVSYGGTLTVGATTITFSEFEAASTVELNGATTLTVRTPNAADLATVDTVTGGRFRVAGSSGGVTMIPILADTTNVTLDAATNDGAAGTDTVTVILAGVVAAGRSATIETGPGNDTVNVQSLAVSTALTVNAGTGDDTIRIDSNGAAAGGTVDNVRGTVAIDGQGGNDTLTLEDSSDTTADVVTVTAMQVGVAGDSFFGAGGSLTYAQIPTLTLNMPSDATGDIINVTPSAATAFNVNGFAPVTSTGIGDRLNLDLTGATTPVNTPSSAVNGQWTFGNRLPVTYTDIEEQGAAATPPGVGGVGVNDGTSAQRSRVTSLTVTFTTQVTFAGAVADAFQLSRLGGGAVGGFTATANVVGGVTVVTLTGFTGAETRSGSLADGFVRVTVLAGQVSAGGLQLDGDGNGSPGGDFVQDGTLANGLFSLFGDADGSGVVNALDYATFRPTFGSSVGQAAYVDWLDFDNDGAINAFDYARFRDRFGSSVP